MELVYITRAVRRYWWLTTSVVLVSLALGFLAGGGRAERFEATALVLVGPLGEVNSGATGTDRFVQNQLVVFESASMAERVAADLGEDDPADLDALVEFEQVVGTDIVSITATSGSPEQARDVANAYAMGYDELIAEQVAQARAPELEYVETELATVEQELTELNQEIAQILQPFLGAPAGGPAVPTIEQVAPGLATEQALLSDRAAALVDIRNDLTRAQSQLQAGNRSLQLAELPTDAAGGQSALILAASLFVGVIAGALAAVALARSSGRVLDAGEVEDALGTPITATIPRSSQAADRSNLLADPMSGSFVPVIHELCVRAEASESDGGLTVAVIGTETGAGVTTIAAAMAAHFGEQGLDVLLVDLDTVHPELSRLAGVESTGSAALFRPEHAISNSRPKKGGALAQATVDAVSTDAAGVSFTGIGTEPRRVSRESMEQAIAATRRSSSVVVFDGGTMLDAASSVRLAELADVVVLAIPIKRQRASTLAVVGQRLGLSRATVLPVITPTSGPRATWRNARS
jgi:Mrp family chromosome partitioning ATPase